MSLLRRRDFLLIFIAFALSHVGDYVALVTLTLRIEAATDSGWAVAALLLTGLLPPLLLAPAVGLLVDRVETVRVLVGAAMVQTAAAAALAFTPGVAPTLVLSFVLGAGAAVTQPALFALLPRAVGEDRVTQGNAYLEVARWGGAAAGPVLAAVLTAAFGAQTALLANAVTFLVVAAVVPLLRIRRPPEPVPTEQREGGQARQGMTFLLRDPLLRLLVPIVGLMIVFAAADNVAEVFFATDVLDTGATGYGVLVTTWTLGMVAGSIAAGRWARPESLGPVVLVGAVIGGGAVVAAAAAAVFPIAVSMFFIGGVANGAELVAMRSLLHHRVPDRLRGRAFAAYYGIVHAAQIIALGASGGLVEWAGARTTMLLAGTGTAAVGLVGWVLYAKIRSDLRRPSPAPVPAVEPSVPA
jgi:MFS family permease